MIGALSGVRRPALNDMRLLCRIVVTSRAAPAAGPARVRIDRHPVRWADGALAAGTVRKIHSTLHKALSQAVSDGLIPRNAAAVKAPSPATEEMRPLLEAEARAFLGATRESGDASRPSTCWRSPPA